MQIESSDASARHLPRKLGAWSGAAVVVGVIIGSGIFRVPSPIAAETGSLSGVALVWIAGGIVALFGAVGMPGLVLGPPGDSQPIE